MPAEVTGALELRKALKEYAPFLAKESQKELSALLKPIAVKARGFMPSNEEAPSGWLKRENAGGRWANRYYDQVTARKGIVFSTAPSKFNRKGFKSLAAIYNKSAAGAIYETAGRKSGITGNFTPHLGGEIKGYNQKLQGRGIFRAWSEDQGRTNTAVIRAIERANEKVASLAKMGGGKLFRVTKAE
jgi:hypothetical protein